MVQNFGIEEACQTCSFLQELNQILLEQMRIEICVLILYDILNHQGNWADLVFSESHVDGRLPVRVSFIEQRVIDVKKLLIVVTQQSLDRFRIEWQVSDQILHVQLQEHLEEYFWVGLISHQQLYVTLSLAREYTLDQHQFSQSRLRHFYLEYVIKLGLALLIIILVLEAHFSVIVELASEEQMVWRLYLDVVDWAQGMDVSLETFFVLNDSAFLLPER